MGFISHRVGNEWTDATWDPVAGCSPVGPGCTNCIAAIRVATLLADREKYPLYADLTVTKHGRHTFNGKMSAREAGHPDWVWPLVWPGSPEPKLGLGQPSLIFVGGMADLFHENRPTSIIDRVVDTMAISAHIGLFLERRSDRMAAYFSAPRPAFWRQKVWLGFSAERQREFDQRWELMRALPQQGWTTFVSVAPMIGPVILPPDFLAQGNRVWVICSGEQGRQDRLRPMDPDWARSLRDQCATAGVPFFMKQMTALGEIPMDLFVREFPALR